MTEECKIALVTGGMGGLGQTICRRLAGEGLAVVALHSPANPRVQQWLAEHEREGYQFDAQAVDVADYASCAAAVDAIRARHGPISVLVNNAGITRDASFRKMLPEDWQAVLRTNLDSVFNMTRQVVEDMLALGWGRIVNISSVNGQRGAFGQANYAASKAGMHGFTKSLALEFGSRNITVNTVSPGYVATEMVMAVPEDVRNKIAAQIPVGRLGEPDEIAYAVAFLVHQEAAWITGANLSINGGQYMGW